MNQTDIRILSYFEEAIASMPEVLEVHLITGEFDYLMRVAARSTADYETLLILYRFFTDVYCSSPKYASATKVSSPRFNSIVAESPGRLDLTA
jgi:DNA-binding Lrp family transcriptional regulator